MLELAEMIWRRGQWRRPLRIVSDPPFEHDVQRRIPDTRKAHDVLGFEAATSLERCWPRVIPGSRPKLMPAGSDG